MLYRVIIAVCSEIHTQHINTLCGQNVYLLHVKPGGTYSDHWAVRVKSLYKNQSVMLYREIIVVFSQIHQKKHINTLCGQNVEL